MAKNKLEELFGDFNVISGETNEIPEEIADVLASGETNELVDIDKLFQKIDFAKVDKIVQNSDNIKRKDVRTKRSSRKRGIINEDYLRELIGDEVSMVMDNMLDTILEHISYSVEKFVHSAKPKVTTETAESTNKIKPELIKPEKEIFGNDPLSQLVKREKTLTKDKTKK